MKNITFSRRAALWGAAVLPAIRVLQGQSKPKAVVISSANRFNGGVNCCAKAMEIIKAGGDTLDAAIAGVNIVELDPRDNSVGYGGLPNEDGVVELDASCIHGPTRRMGAVGALQGIKTPSKVAQLVMEQTDHMMLVGAGALKFAKAMGFEEENLLTEASRKAWVAWKISLGHGGHSNWGPGLDAPPSEETERRVIGELRRAFPHDSDAELAAACRDRAPSAARHHQLHRAEREGRDVGRDHHQRHGVENAGPRRRFADHRRRTVARSGRGRSRVHWTRRREPPRLRRATPWWRTCATA